MFGTATNQALDAQLKKAGLMNWREVSRDAVPGDLLFIITPGGLSAGKFVLNPHTIGLVISNVAFPWDGHGYERGTMVFDICSSLYKDLNGKRVIRNWADRYGDDCYKIIRAQG